MALWYVISRSTNSSKPLQPGDRRVVVPAGAVEDEQLPVLVPATHNTHVGVLQAKDQVAGQDLVPGDRIAVTMLGGGSAAVANNIFHLSLGM